MTTTITASWTDLSYSKASHITNTPGMKVLTGMHAESIGRGTRDKVSRAPYTVHCIVSLYCDATIWSRSAMRIKQLISFKQWNRRWEILQSAWITTTQFSSEVCWNRRWSETRTRRWQHCIRFNSKLFSEKKTIFFLGLYVIAFLPFIKQQASKTWHLNVKRNKRLASDPRSLQGKFENLKVRACEIITFP